MSLSFGLVYIRSIFSKNRNEYINNYYRRQGMVIGEDVHIFCELMSREPYLIKIGDNTFIGAGSILMYGLQLENGVSLELVPL